MVNREFDVVSRLGQQSSCPLRPNSYRGFVNFVTSMAKGATTGTKECKKH